MDEDRPTAPGWSPAPERGDQGLRPPSPGQRAPATQLLPAPSTEAADWIAAALAPCATSVHSLVPRGFRSYVRVFHPAWRDPHRRDAVRWADIAAANGTRVDPAMELHELTRGLADREQPQPGVYAWAPEVGSLPVEVVTPLIEVLGAHTTTPDHCWIGFWDGFGDERPDVGAPTFAVPQRAYRLLTGPLAAAAESSAEHRHQSPNLWWPADRAWCVATEIDLDTTYVGCDDACRDAILAEPRLRRPW